MAMIVSPLFLGRTVSAAQITTRSLTLQAGVADGGSKPGGVVKHQFTFSAATTGNVGSIQFMYCTTASGACAIPTGLVTTAATVTNQVGAVGFTMNNTTAGIPYLTRASASIPTGTALTYQLSTITNPTTTNQAFYVRISTFASIDTSGGAVDTGTVTASTAQQIVLTGTMPESLIFCTGATVSLSGSIPNCATATSGVINFNQLFSPSDTATASSQMAASTNAVNGYSIAVFGTTLTSGSNTILAMSPKAAGTRGTGQFGLNLKLNTVATSTVPIGAEITALPNGTNLKGESTANYSTVDQFKFTSGENIADSASGGAGPSDGQVFTASYIVNVTGSQPAGTYTTTLTYICTSVF